MIDTFLPVWLSKRSQVVESQGASLLLPYVSPSIQEPQYIDLVLPVTAETFTVALAEALPPLPAQVSVYVVAWLRAEEVVEPDVGLVPDHPLEAVQLVVLTELQLKVVVCPAEIGLGEALKLTVGVATVAL